MEAWRSSIVSTATTWLLTPWAHNQCVKGAGVDCGRFVHAVYAEAGMVAPADFGRYSADWMLHNSEERYLGFVEQYLDRIDGPPLPGDVAVWRYGHCFSHGAIVVEWPSLLHAYKRERGVVWGDGTAGELAREHLKGGGSRPREVRFYSIAGRL